MIAIDSIRTRSIKILNLQILLKDVTNFKLISIAIAFTNDCVLSNFLNHANQAHPMLHIHSQ